MAAIIPFLPVVVGLVDQYEATYHAIVIRKAPGSASREDEHSDDWMGRHCTQALFIVDLLALLQRRDFSIYDFQPRKRQLRVDEASTDHFCCIALLSPRAAIRK